ncbi:Hypothetical protein ORPV_1123 [Orpheovirus IHUMI-LCC2]|uniref:Uncharacterized protein n=1 Tax=Orpheovirus IHUMI-LCC2 TaxID=2023057 RepID=A0A2I2L674_9VIRU|nr:Hypothetical protein ORPV_1123 [Orpheovirus IHUMI-LCC2]SNW63027.1 Hypothetical protein ORPV_1123 [Orpheovirus IHUMI-LCC2]
MSILPTELYVNILSNQLGTRDFINSYRGIVSTLSSEGKDTLDKQLSQYIIRNIIGLNDNSDIYKAYNLEQLINLLNFNLDLNQEFVRIRDYNFFVTQEFKEFLGRYFLGDYPILKQLNIMEVCTLIKILYGVSYDITRSMSEINNTVVRCLDMKYNDRLMKEILDKIYPDKRLNGKNVNMYNQSEYYTIEDFNIISLLVKFIEYGRQTLLDYMWNKLSEQRIMEIFPELNPDDQSIPMRKMLLYIIKIDRYHDPRLIGNYIVNTGDISILKDINYDLDFYSLDGVMDPVTLTKIMLENNIELPEDFLIGYNEGEYNDNMNELEYLYGLSIRYNRREITDENVLNSMKMAAKKGKNGELANGNIHVIRQTYCPTILRELYDVDIGQYNTLLEFWNGMSFYVRYEGDTDGVQEKLVDMFNGRIPESGGTDGAVLTLLSSDVNISLYWYFRYGTSSELTGNFKRWSKYKEYKRLKAKNPNGN